MRLIISRCGLRQFYTFFPVLSPIFGSVKSEGVLCTNIYGVKCQYPNEYVNFFYNARATLPVARVPLGDVCSYAPPNVLSSLDLGDTPYSKSLLLDDQLARTKPKAESGYSLLIHFGVVGWGVKIPGANNPKVVDSGLAKTLTLSGVSFV